MNPARLARIFRGASSSLLARPLYSALMMAGLVIGIASVTVIYEMGEGVRSQVLSMMNNMGFGAQAFYIRSGGGRLGFRHGRSRALVLSWDDARAIAGLQGVDATVPHLSLSRKELSARGRHTFTRVLGTTPGYTSARNWPVTQGRFLLDSDIKQRKRVAVLGSSTAYDLFPGQSPLGRTIKIGRAPFTVIGVLSSKGASWRGHDRDDRALVPLTTAQRRLANLDRFSGMRVNLLANADKQEVIDLTRDLLRRQHKLPPQAPDDFMIITPEALVEMITRQSRSLVFMLTIISAVSLVVAGIVIMNIMLVAVGERTREIGLRRALGARRGDILAQFLMESMLVALLGGGMGLAFGFGLSRAVSLGLDLPTAFSLEGFLVSFLFSATVGLVFGLAPARRAAGLPAAECVR